MSFTLDSRLAADTVPVGDLPLCTILLMNDARFRGSSSCRAGRA
jgi:hypothetical protein